VDSSVQSQHVYGISWMDIYEYECCGLCGSSCWWMGMSVLWMVDALVSDARLEAMGSGTTCVSDAAQYCSSIAEWC
jgi:hypothetical protein